MCRSFILFILLFGSEVLWCQQTTVQYDKTLQQFINSHRPPDSKPAGDPLRSVWNGDSVCMVTCEHALDDDKPQQAGAYDDLVVQLFRKNKSGAWVYHLVDTIGQEGGWPVIERIFFANADKDKATELVMLVSWEQQHYDFTGVLYDTYVFNDAVGQHAGKLRLLEAITKKLDGGCDCTWRDGEVKKVALKDEAAIKKKLKQMGY